MGNRGRRKPGVLTVVTPQLPPFGLASASPSFSPLQVLADLGKTSSDFRQLATKALDQLCGGLMPRLRPVLDDAAAASYELSEADLAPGGGASGWPQALLLAFAVHLAWLQPLLAPGAYDSLVHLVLDKASTGMWG